MRALTAARAELQRARLALMALVKAVPQPPVDRELTALADAHLLKVQTDGDLALAEHVGMTVAARTAEAIAMLRSHGAAFAAGVVHWAS